MKSSFWFPVLAILIMTAGCAGNPRLQDKAMVGETEIIVAEEAGLAYLARIDTGARTTSIHAVDLKIENPSPDKEQNIGKQVTFVTFNDQQERRQLRRPIVDVTEVRNAQGTEYRYMVPMTLDWQGRKKDIHINLRDRSAMTYKLLIGRDWLRGDYLVDVEKGTPEL